METCVHEEEIDWKGKVHRLQLYASTATNKLEPLTQVQAVAITPKGEIVLYKHIDGYFGLPGGTPENGEDWVSTLRREIGEEIACRVVQYGVFGYEKDTEVDSGFVKYQLRLWAEVEPSDDVVNDPDGKAIERITLPLNEAITCLGWGLRGEKMIRLAYSDWKSMQLKG